jgi:myo-inositol-1(or 4)-monophosphatase
VRRETATAIRAAACAQRIADAREGAGEIRSKGGIDLVTAADVACEDAIRGELARDFPEQVIVGEERGGAAPDDGHAYWLVDPICGTRPYASDVPLYCSNVALVEDGVVTVAAVAIGRTGEIAWAELGGGAYLRSAGGDRPIAVDASSHTLWFNGREAADAVRDAMLSGRWYVWLFSSTLAYAYLASGRIAGLVHVGTSPIHAAAGCRLAEEAGAVVSDRAGAPWDARSRGFVAAATPGLHRELLELLSARSSS